MMSSQQDVGAAARTLLNYLGQKTFDSILIWLTFKSMDNVITPLLSQLINKIRSGQQPSPSEIEQLMRLLQQLQQSQSQAQLSLQSQSADQLADQLANMIIEKLKQAGYISPPQAPSQSTTLSQPRPSPAPPGAEYIEYIRDRIQRLERERDNLQAIKYDLQRQYYMEFDENRRKEIEKRIEDIDMKIRDLNSEIDRLRLQLLEQTYR